MEKALHLGIVSPAIRPSAQGRGVCLVAPGTSHSQVARPHNFAWTDACGEDHPWQTYYSFIKMGAVLLQGCASRPFLDRIPGFRSFVDPVFTTAFSIYSGVSVKIIFIFEFNRIRHSIRLLVPFFHMSLRTFFYSPLRAFLACRARRTSLTDSFYTVS